MPFLISFIVIAFCSSLFISLFYVQYTKPINLFYTFASFFFIFALLLPFLDETFNLFKSNNQEKRVLAKKLALQSDNILDYPKEFEKYYNDNFGFRTLLVNLGGEIKYQIFKTSSVPSKAAVGKDGWIFLDGTVYGITQDLTKQNLYTPELLKQTVVEWERRINHLKKDGIAFYYASWPDKQYIYPEFMPFAMKIINKDTMSICDQAMNYLKAKGSDFKIVDVREALKEEKKKHQVYKKYDSHWNSYGAFVAYSKLMQHISIDFPELKPYILSDFSINFNEQSGGDLAEMLGLDLKEKFPQLTLKKNPVQVNLMPVDSFPTGTIIHENKGASTKLTLLVFRDSFTSELLQFLDLHFSKIILLWNVPYSDEMVKKVKPNIVLECYATRYFK